jgi:Arc/MetJ-type ribon-helix-helix transcriptional regulator
MATTKTETIAVRLPREVVDILDALVERELFSNRSEAIREFCREYLREAR